MKDYFIRVLLQIYKTKKSTKLRTIIKTFLKDRKIDLKYRSFSVNVSSSSAVELKVLFDEYDEAIILNLIELYSRNNYNFIDIGANIGLHSLTAASSNPNIEIFSFEPEPTNFQDFLNNITLNKFKSIRPFMMGLGNVIKNETLYINEAWNKGKHSLKNQFSTNSKVVIPISTLDTFENNINSSDLFVKIDVEGYEKEVIEGAINVLSNTKDIVLSIELVSGNNEAQACQDIINIIMSYGFEKLYKIKDSKLIEVSKYEESADYILIKGDQSKALFNELIGN